MTAYLQFAGCITCSRCVAACPVTAIDRLFLGPQALAQARTYVSATERRPNTADGMRRAASPEPATATRAFIKDGIERWMVLDVAK